MRQIDLISGFVPEGTLKGDRSKLVKDLFASRLTLQRKEMSEAICEIIVQTDWANESAKGVERLSTLADIDNPKKVL